ncbi:low temperature requirement protein A [Comamonas sp. lk]|uniref:low temperature requirement protein A n=1 Tax=Comamonas sp. lk TaxID=2201272 RepID=UPI000EB13323|nr:low temperature requirement protein A [Comamonas sp. lk]
MAAKSPSAGTVEVLRQRDGHHAKVTFEELFFDLVYVFAVTQISHELLHNLTLKGLLETLVLWFAVWLGWQYTCWVTNWLNPETPRVRGLLFVTMLLALVMASSLPQAFGSRGLVFAVAYVCMQVGRTALVLWMLPRSSALRQNYARMLGWLVISAGFWIAGGLAEHEWRIVLWIVAALCEYVSPMWGFALPGLGRSSTRDWTIEGAHLAERCQLFVIVALGETLLASGAMFADGEWNTAVISALLATFLGTLALWWLYFGTASKDATELIVKSSDPGRVGAYFHYIHAVLVAGIIGSAVANDLIMAHPHEAMKPAYAAVLVGGPAVYLLGSAIYKNVVYGRIPLSHVLGAAVLLVLVPLSFGLDLLTTGWLTTLVLLAVAWWDLRPKR